MDSSQKRKPLIPLMLSYNTSLRANEEKKGIICNIKASLQYAYQGQSYLSKVKI